MQKKLLTKGTVSHNSDGRWIGSVWYLDEVCKLKTTSGKRDVPLNSTAVAMVEELRKERYLGEEMPLVSDESGGFTRPVDFHKRYYRILEAAWDNANKFAKQKGLHSLRHTFATNLVNGVKQPDGTTVALSPKQVADLLVHSTSETTEMYYVRKDSSRLMGVTEQFNL